jgi:porphobilinogen synthase
MTKHSSLNQVAISHASQADVVAPSGMIYGMVAAIRSGRIQMAIMFRSCRIRPSTLPVYGPFREAAQAHEVGDRKTHQMDASMRMKHAKPN